MNGFGWNFYGFFLAAGAWLSIYFLWAWRASSKDAPEPPAREQDSGARR